MTTSPSSSADGLWHHLRLVPELAVLDQPLADGDAACIVVQDGAVQWTGPEASVPAAYAQLPRHDGRGATKHTSVQRDEREWTATDGCQQGGGGTCRKTGLNSRRDVEKTVFPEVQMIGCRHA